MSAMSPEALAQIDEAVDSIRPEAKEYVQSLELIRLSTSKDNYGEVMSFLSRLQKDAGQMAALFLIAMVGEGYPRVTAEQLVGIMGWPSSVSELLTREYLKAEAA